MSTLATIPRPADRVEWLRVRHGYFSASDAGCLYGVHPHRDLADVVADKLGPPPDSDEQTASQDRGHRLEPVLMDWLSEKLGVRIEQPNVMHVSGRLAATLDGIPVGISDEWVEAKTSRDAVDDPPDHWYWQIVAQAAASGRRRCHLVWLDRDMEFKTEIVDVIDSHVADIAERAERFMDFIELGMTPEGVELTSEHLAHMFPAPEPGKYVDITPAEVTSVVARWEATRQARLRYDKHEKALKDEVARLVGDAEGLQCNGLPVVTWKASKDRDVVDWKLLEADHPELVASYRRSVPGARTMRATKEFRQFFDGDEGETDD